MSVIGTISNVEKNNLVPSLGEGYGLTVEPLLRTFSRYDFTFQFTGGNGDSPGGTDLSIIMLAGLLPRVGIDAPYSFTSSSCPLSVEWVRNDPIDGSFQYAGLPGSFTEIWRTFGVELARRLNVDPGFSGRKGQRYTLLLSGTEYRGYVNYNPSGGNTPLAIVAGPIGGFDYPIRLGMAIHDAFSIELQVQDVIVGGDVGSKTIYSLRDKQEDSQIVFTADSGTDVLTSTAHGYVDGASLTVRNSGGGLPGGLSAATTYYVRDRTADTFKIALTSGGSAIDITSNGTGTQYALLNMHFRIYQKSNIPGFPDGVPVDIDF